MSWYGRDNPPPNCPLIVILCPLAQTVGWYGGRGCVLSAPPTLCPRRTLCYDFSVWSDKDLQLYVKTRVEGRPAIASRRTKAVFRQPIERVRTPHRWGLSSVLGLVMGHMCESLSEYLSIVSSGCSGFLHQWNWLHHHHRVYDMTLAVAEVFSPQ